MTRSVIDIVKGIQDSIDKNGTYLIDNSSWQFVASNLNSYERQVEQLTLKNKDLKAELRTRTIENKSLNAQLILHKMTLEEIQEARIKGELPNGISYAELLKALENKELT